MTLRTLPSPTLSPRVVLVRSTLALAVVALGACARSATIEPEPAPIVAAPKAPDGRTVLTAMKTIVTSASGT